MSRKRTKSKDRGKVSLIFVILLNKWNILWKNQLWVKANRQMFTIIGEMIPKGNHTRSTDLRDCGNELGEFGQIPCEADDHDDEDNNRTDECRILCRFLKNH